MIAALFATTTALATSSATVCSPFEAYTASCDFRDLGLAVQDLTIDHFVLQPGLHPANAVIDRAVVIDALPGAVLTTKTADQIVLEVLGGSGSVFTNLVFDGDLGTDPTLLMFVSAATVEFIDLRVRNLDAPDSTSAMWVDTQGDVTLTRPVFENNSFPGAYSALVNYGSLTVREGTFLDTAGPSSIAVIFANSATAVVEESTFTAVANGTALFAGTSSELTLTDTDLWPGLGPGVGIILYDTTFITNGGNIGAGDDLTYAIFANTSIVDMTDTTIQVGVRSTGLQCFGCWSVDLDGVTFDGPVVPSGVVDVQPLVSIIDTPEVDIEDTWFCHASEAGALTLTNACVFGTCEVRRSVFQSNRGDEVSGGINVSGSTLEVDQSTFLGNYTLDPDPGGTIDASASTLSVTRSLFMNGFGGPAMVAAPAPGVETFTENGFAYAYPAATTFPMDSTNDDDVVVVFAALDPAPAPRCGASVDLDAEESDPFLVANDVGAGSYCWDTEVPFDAVDGDCDGTELCAVDTDGDGFGGARLVEIMLVDALAACPALDEDCDDGDPARYPGATDVWYDGIDADCAGDDDFDADRDGYSRDADCDDEDPTVFGVVGCGDADGDGVPATEDCNDADETIGVCRLRGSGCGSAPGPAGLVPLLAALALVRRPRRVETRA